MKLGKSILRSFGVCLVFSILVPSLVPALGQADRDRSPVRERPAGVRGPGPWDNDVLVYHVDRTGQVKQMAAFERAGVPTLARLKDGRLIAAHQYFPEQDETSFDKVAGPRPGVAYHAVSEDGLTFTRVDDVVMEGPRQWLGNAQSDGRAITFFGTGQPDSPVPRGAGQARGGVWLALSTDGRAWKRLAAPPIPGADPGAVAMREGGWVVAVTGPPRPGTPSERRFRDGRQLGQPPTPPEPGFDQPRLFMPRGSEPRPGGRIQVTIRDSPLSARMAPRYFSGIPSRPVTTSRRTSSCVHRRPARPATSPAMARSSP